MFDNAKKLVTGGTDELCEQQKVRIISTLAHCLNHATLGFPLDPREWLTRQAQGTPSSTRIFPSLQCRLSGSPPMCPGDATRILFRVLASIATLSDLDLRSFDVPTAHLHGDIDGEVYMEPPTDTETGSVLERDRTHPGVGTRVYLLIFNYIQSYTCFRTCAWPAWVLVVEEGRREDDDKAREGSNLYLQLGGPITEPVNGGSQFWALFNLDLVSTLYSTPGAGTLSIYKLLAVCLPRLYTSHTPCFTSKAGDVRTIPGARTCRAPSKSTAKAV